MRKDVIVNYQKKIEKIIDNRKKSFIERTNKVDWHVLIFFFKKSKNVEYKTSEGRETIDL